MIQYSDTLQIQCGRFFSDRDTRKALVRFAISARETVENEGEGGLADDAGRAPRLPVKRKSVSGGSRP